MKREILHSRSGETLTEVTAAMVIFLIVAAVLQGAVTFGVSAMKKSKEIRQRNTQICRDLQSAAYTDSGSGAEFSFRAISADGSESGTAVLFRVNTGLGHRDVSYTDENGNEKTVTFYVYGEAGGEGP